MIGDNYIVFTQGQHFAKETSSYLRLTDSQNRDHWSVTNQPLPINPILDLDPESCRLSGLSSKICWKTQNPMEQLSSTFNPTTLESLKVWFDGSFLYGSFLYGEKSKLYPRKTKKYSQESIKKNYVDIPLVIGTQAISGIRH